MNIETLLQELTLEEKASLCSGADFWHTKAVERLGVPAVMVCDGPNGLRKQEAETDHLGMNESIKAVCFPTASALASSFDTELARELGETLGDECRAENVAMLLGPGVNIKRSPLCGRNFEYYSEDPYQSTQMATAYIDGLQSKGVGACIKHFAANNQEDQRQVGDSVVEERTLREIYLASFEGAIKDSAPWGVMCSYNQVNGTFSAENKELLTDILRTEWGYDGMVITDWGAVKDRVKGILAGLDLEMPGGIGALENDAQIVKAVQEGTITMEQLDQAVENVLRFLEKNMANPENTAVFDREKDYRKAVEAAKECAVLLKNDKELLPLKKDRKVAFIGGFVEHPRIQGGGSSYINSTKVPALKQLIESQPSIQYAKGFSVTDEDGNSEEKDLLAEAVELAKSCETAVIFAGLPGSFETEGADRTHIELPEEQNRLIAEVCAVQPNTVVVLSNGAPVTMPWVNEVSAILEMYLTGDGTSEATMALLYGEANPSGKLAETFPLRLEDTPAFLNFPGERGVARYQEDIFVGYRWYDKRKMPVLFPFGHGLSYTSFAYSDLQLSSDKMKDTDTVTVSVKVTNTGKCAGKEVVQLYVGAKKSEVRRPIRELKGFAKVKLEPGESQMVTFTLDKRSFAYYETQLHDWFAESGEYEISIGASSRDIRQVETIQVESTQMLPLTVSMTTSVGTLLNHPATAPFMNQFVQSEIEKRQAMTGAVSYGEGSESIEASALDMPIGALASFGLMSQEQLQGMITMLQACVDGKNITNQ